MNIDQFLSGYIEAALWSSTNVDGEPLDATYGREDIAPGTLEAMRSDCARFVAENAVDLQLYGNERPPLLQFTSAELAGHDFWLTRNRHGAGFWDRGLPDDLGKRLTDAANAFGEVDLYVNDNGEVTA